LDKLGNLQSRNIQSNISPGYAKSTDKRLFSTAVRAKHDELYEVPEASNTPEMSIKVASMMLPRHVSLNPNPKKSSIKRIELPAIYAERLGRSPSQSKLSNSPSNLDLKDYNQTSQAEFKKGRSKRKRQSSVLPAHMQDPSQSNPLTQDPRSHSPQSNTLPKIKIKKKSLGHTFEARRHSQLKPQQSYNIEAIKKIQNLMTSPSARKLKYSPSKISIKSHYKRNHRKQLYATEAVSPNISDKYNTGPRLSLQLSEAQLVVE